MEQNKKIDYMEKENKKRRWLKILTGTEYPSKTRIVISIIGTITGVPALIVMICLVFAWNATTRPAAEFTIKKAIKMNSFTATLVSDDKDLYSIKYNNGIYYCVKKNEYNEDMLAVWSIDDDGETVKYAEKSFDTQVDDEQAVLNSLKDITPHNLDVTDLLDEWYILYRSFTVEIPSVRWMGESKSLVDFCSKAIKTKNLGNFYGAELSLPNESLTCVVAYELSSLKLRNVETVITVGTTVYKTIKFRIADNNRTNFDFQFK